MVGTTARRMAASTASLRGRPRGLGACRAASDISGLRIMERRRSGNARAWPWVPDRREPRPEAVIEVVRSRLQEGPPTMKALVLNCTLKRSPETSNTEALARVVMEAWRKEGIESEI